VAKRFSAGRRSSKEQHVADRKIDIKLYTLYSSLEGVKLNPTFLSEAHALPLKFSDDAHQYLSFLRKWGRYVPVAASYGGTVIIQMKFETSSNDKDFSAGVEGAFDLFLTKGSAGVSVDSRVASLQANSKISLLANGGDPQIAAAITDFTPQTHKTTSFRGDLQQWILSVPKFPRLVERIPRLKLISSILPDYSEGIESHIDDACDTLQHTALHFNTLQHTKQAATRCKALHAAPHITTHAATRCNTL